MRRAIRSRRTPVVFLLLSLALVAPILYLSGKISIPSAPRDQEFHRDINDAKHAGNAAIEQKSGKGLKEPDQVVYRDGDNNSEVGGKPLDDNLDKDAGEETVNVNGGENREKTVSVPSEGQGHSDQDGGSQPSGPSSSQKETDEIIRVMKDQLIAAKAFLNFTSSKSDSLVENLRLQIKKLERLLGEVNRNSDFSVRALETIRSMETVLSKASQAYSVCPAAETQLHAMIYNNEEQALEERSWTKNLSSLAAMSLPKGLHCLSMLLTVEFLSLPPEYQELPNKQRFQQKNLHHYAIFSDNVIACAVVVNSTISNSMEPEKIVFHVLTDDLNLPAMTMWFLANPPGRATIQVQRMDGFKFFISNYISMLKQSSFQDPTFFLALNHLYFHLSQIFPMLHKIVLLDHDVVVQRDLQELWSADMMGKVNGAVKTCDDDLSHRMDLFTNFSDPNTAKRSDVKVCAWAFGVNVFDLQEWRKQNLTSDHKWFQWGKEEKLWKTGSLQLDPITFYNLTVVLDQEWHVVGLGHNPNVTQEQIEKAAVIHYDGNLKPWLEFGIPKYRGYWNKFVNYTSPYLRKCNIILQH